MISTETQEAADFHEFYKPAIKNDFCKIGYYVAKEITKKYMNSTVNPEKMHIRGDSTSIPSNNTYKIMLLLS